VATRARLVLISNEAVAQASEARWFSTQGQTAPPVCVRLRDRDSGSD